MEQRLIEYEDKTEKRFNDIEEKLKIIAEKQKNSKEFLEEMTEKKTRDSEKKLQSLFEKVYSQDTVCKEEREENGEKFDKLDITMKCVEKKFESAVGNVEEKFQSSIAIVLEELQASITNVEKKLDTSSTTFDHKLESLTMKVYNLDSVFQADKKDNGEKILNLLKTNETAQEKMKLILKKEMEMDEIKEKFGTLNNNVLSFKDRIDTSATMIDTIEEKMYDYEISKKNNLIFYGIPAPRNETRASLTQTIQDIIHINLQITRDISVDSVHRVLKGPEVRGCRPVLATFAYFKDRNEVFKKSKLMRTNSSIMITEDMSKKTREARHELQKYLVHLARSSPSKKAVIRYDKLYVDGEVFVFSEEEGKVVPQHGSGSR